MVHSQELFGQARAWAQIDHQLISLKMTQAATEFSQRKSKRESNYPTGNRWGILVATLDDRIESAKEWTEKVFEIYGEVWERQGKARTPDFVRAVFDNALLLAIEARVGTAKSEMTLSRQRTGYPHSLTPLLHKLVQDADRLKSHWRGRIEIEARELQLEQAKRSVHVVGSLGASDVLERFSPAQEIHKSNVPGGPQSRAHSFAEGVMEDTGFWRGLEARFRALYNEQLQERNKAGLHAEWNSNPANGEPWYLGGGPDDIRTNFEWLAESAAVRLGQPGGRNAVFFWLDLLRGESPHYRPLNSSQIVKGKETRWESGTIELVCQASAEYCIKCETQELERKRRSRRMRAFAGHKSSERPAALTPEAILRGLAAKFAKDGKPPAQPASTVPSLGGAGQTEKKDEKAQPLVTKPKGLPRASRERGPDLKTSRERVALEDKLRTELASVAYSDEGVQ
jgi:hypothetical protein